MTLSVLFMLQYIILKKDLNLISSMKKELSAIGIGLSVLFLASTITNNATAQNLSTNVSNAAGNMSASANQTGSEMGQKYGLAG
jgi:multisubunit Na+/H+ antiporter MnhB subunit